MYVNFNYNIRWVLSWLPMRMMFAFARAVLFGCMCLIVSSDAAARGSTCRTPNNERATCIPIRNCTVIKEAIVTRNSDAAYFAKKSQCGYDREPLVCCGSTGYTVPSQFFSSNSSSGGTVTPLKHSLLPNASACGIENSYEKVYGGEKTNLDEFPWIVLLRYQKNTGADAGFKCGGSLINHRYVLTAAHCMAPNLNGGLSLTSVRLGEWKISTKRDCLPNGECAEPVIDVEIQSSVSHPLYRRRNRENDIGLIRLARNIRYTDFIRPICIPSSDSSLPVVGSKFDLAGWGATENSSFSDVKLKVKVPLVGQAECASKLAKRVKITEYQVCAGGIAGEDSCQGDSGGPLMRAVENNSPEGNQWFLEGIVSGGIGCGLPGYPGVYTRVSKYANWITANIKVY